jgi:hypothetical protein
MDILQFVQLYRFVMYGTTWRPLWVILIFYGIRALIQMVNVFEFPPGYTWDFPGWFSFFVPYG